MKKSAPVFHRSVSHKYVPGRLRFLAFAGAVLFGACADSPSQPDDPRLSGPATIEVAAGASQVGTVGSAVPVAPAVVVRNAQGSPVSGVAVQFTVTAGGGTIEQASAVTDVLGTAHAGTWVLGPTPGSNILQATINGLTVNITASAESPFSIEVRWIGSPTANQRDVVARAVSRWRSIILSELSDVQFRAPARACFPNQPAIEEVVDDLLLYVEFAEIDGVNGTLAEAGPCYIRNDNNLPLFGGLKLDAADVSRAEATGTLDAIVLHEIGHVLGFGTIWQEKGLLTGARSSDPSSRAPARSRLIARCRPHGHRSRSRTRGPREPGTATGATASSITS